MAQQSNLNIMAKHLASTFSRTSNQLRSYEPLTNDQLFSVAPSIFAENAAPDRSKNYTYHPTIQLIDALRGEGFQPFMVAQARSRTPEGGFFAKHMLRMRHPDAISNGMGVSNEIIVINSHNGSTSTQLLSGVFRFVCMNGMVCGTIEQDIRVQHRGNHIGDIIDGAFKILNQFDGIDDSIESMMATRLILEEQVAMARTALAIRFAKANEYDFRAPITEQAVLEPRRSEDTGVDLWSTFNRIQENLVDGGLRQTKKPARKTRGVRGIDGNLTLNRQLWALAVEMNRIKNG